MKDHAKQPTRAERICLKAFAATTHDPGREFIFVDADDLGEIGYNLRMSSNQLLSGSSQHSVDQGIRWSEHQEIAVIAGIEATKEGGLTLKVN